MASGSYRKLLYEYEVLRARLEIRDHFMGTVVRDIYDNISQVLTLVRVQLSQMELAAGRQSKGKTRPPGELVGSAIRELRNMCRRFSPDAGMISCEGFRKGIREALLHAAPGAVFTEFEPEDTVTINGEKGVVLFSILLEIFKSVMIARDGAISKFEMRLSEGKALFTLDYAGDWSPVSVAYSEKDPVPMSMEEKIKLLKGKLKKRTSNPGAKRLILEVPVN